MGYKHTTGGTRLGLLQARIRIGIAVLSRPDEVGDERRSACGLLIDFQGHGSGALPAKLSGASQRFLAEFLR